MEWIGLLILAALGYAGLRWRNTRRQQAYLRRFELRSLIVTDALDQVLNQSMPAARRQRTLSMARAAVEAQRRDTPPPGVDSDHHAELVDTMETAADMIRSALEEDWVTVEELSSELAESQGRSDSIVGSKSPSGAGRTSRAGAGEWELGPLATVFVLLLAGAFAFDYTRDDLVNLYRLINGEAAACEGAEEWLQDTKSRNEQAGALLMSVGNSITAGDLSHLPVSEQRMRGFALSQRQSNPPEAAETLNDMIVDYHETVAELFSAVVWGDQRAAAQAETHIRTLDEQLRVQEQSFTDDCLS